MGLAARTLKLQGDQVLSLEVIKRALDARARHKKPRFRFTVDVELSQPPKKGAPKQANLREVPQPKPLLSSPQAQKDASPVVVVGAGPAGLFCAWHLAEQGAKVILLERGKPVETRARDFGRFRGRGELNPESNICFGEGGAGTYSDGKLYTRKNNPLIREVLTRMVACGAPEQILIDAKPHIGTNLLFRMLKGIRQELINHGVEIRFETKMKRLWRQNGKTLGVELSNGEQIDSSQVVLAIGHSARDTFEELAQQSIPMEAKPFAVGVRAEHPQELIDGAQYHSGRGRPNTLPPADYRLAHQAQGNRGVYSFCMCPGGMIVPTATEPNMVVVNGMSTARRSTPFANTGLVVQVGLEDIAREGFGEGPLSGVEFQRHLERMSFKAGGENYFAPAMRASDFAAGKNTGKLAATHFRPGLTATDMREVLPRFITEAMAEGLSRFDKQIKGYASEEANLIAVESRTSSPIRIPRDPEGMEVEGFSGVYVAGEGPGYAGGIMSAAIDGLRVAQSVLHKLS